MFGNMTVLHAFAIVLAIGVQFGLGCTILSSCDYMFVPLGTDPVGCSPLNFLQGSFPSSCTHAWGLHIGGSVLQKRSHQGCERSFIG